MFQLVNRAVNTNLPIEINKKASVWVSKTQQLWMNPIFNNCPSDRRGLSSNGVLVRRNRLPNLNKINRENSFVGIKTNRVKKLSSMENKIDLDLVLKSVLRIFQYLGSNTKNLKGKPFLI